jgi:hypothetical protein
MPTVKVLIKASPLAAIVKFNRKRRGMDSYLRKQLDRINRIVRIERPSAGGISPQANKIPSIL